MGRARRCRLRFSDPQVSRVHLRITVTDSEITAEDLDSRGGSWINGERLEGTRVLQAGDVVRVGTREFTLCEQIEPTHLTQELPLVAASVLLDAMECEEDRSAERPTSGVRLQADHLRRHTYRPRNPTEPVVLDRTDRRRAKRVHTNIPAMYSSSGLLLHGMVRDLSPSGMFIASDLLDPPGTHCQIDLMPEDTQTLSFEGIVRHVVDASTGRSGRPPGFGIEFTHVAEETQLWLQTFLSKKTGEGA